MFRRPPYKKKDGSTLNSAVPEHTLCSGFAMHSSRSNGASAATAVELQLHAAAPAVRRHEPVTCGVPWPRGVLSDPADLRLEDSQGARQPLQARVLDIWPDGSVRWVLLDWQASVSGTATYRLILAREHPISTPPAPPLRVSDQDGLVSIDTGAARFQLRAGGPFPFTSAAGGAGGEIRTQCTVEDEAGAVYQLQPAHAHLEESGPLRAVVRLEGYLATPVRAPWCKFTARLHFFAGSPTVRFDLTLHNPRRAEHPGGLWDLGDPGSVYIRDASFTATLPAGEGAAVVRYSPELGAPFESAPPPLELYQDSSGGENWKSTNHINRKRAVPNSFRGYRLRAGGAERTGLRATPALSLTRGGHTLAVAVPEFWQNFPRAVEASADALTVRLFPRQYADVHELQGGEQKTHTFYVAFGPDAVADEPLDWCRARLLPQAPPEWYCATGAVPYLTPKVADPNADYLRLVDAALEGADTFEHKREIIDEYGWRHFGDIYGDHEAVYHKGPTPLVSHYNNQYDPVAGFAYQFLRSGDARWWRQMDELARHVIDIDIYHTDQDKSAYNHGLFWHTYHYVDADTAMHRSYPRRGTISAGPAPGADQPDPGIDLPWSPRKGTIIGGGPANEQNYTTGLLLHYFLTGSEASRAAALELAQYVLDLDDGRKTVFRWLARGDTGRASSSGDPSYHGPGRGAGNSVNVLLDAHRLTGEGRFLAKAERLIRRCIHPADDLARRDLLNAERRWFYTVFLQALGRYLDDKAQRGELDRMYAYARASLLHYARWMAEHEYPFLDKPEKLEYPTETWAAQDMRKSEVFKLAARHAAGAEKARFLERSEFFFRSSTGTLSGMETRTLARPVILLLSYGFMHAYFQQHPETSAPPPAQPEPDFGRPEEFVPQKAIAKKRAVLLAGAAAVVGILGIAGLVFYALG
jgi:hypothetical protein